MHCHCIYIGYFNTHYTMSHCGVWTTPAGLRTSSAIPERSQSWR